MDQTLPGLSEDSKELTPLTVIRTETALSRFPVHRIAKKGNVQIEIKNQASALVWEVSYNSKYGQPGPLAYKLDTLIVNRRIEEAGRPVPKFIRLGSLRDIAEEIGAGEKNTSGVKNALLQNASAFINARIAYRALDRSERTLEAAFNRYSLVFTGEHMPDGNTADAVYLVLNDVYMEVLNAAMHRPLDYDYMKALPPAAQRFYEIVSYQIYAALHFQNERAKLRYSDYCLLSTATRCMDFDHVKKQMWKIHRPHLESGYLAKVMYETTTDDVGNADWWMYYVPGPNASREYREFTGHVRKPPKGGRGAKRGTAVAEDAGPLLPFADAELDPGTQQARTGQAQSSANEGASAQNVLIAELIAQGLNGVDAERLAREIPEECRRQLDYLPFKTDLEKPGGWLARAIPGRFGPPDAYKEAQARQDQERKKQEATERRKAAEALRMAQEATEAARIDQTLAQLENDAPEAFSSFLAYVASERRKVEAKYAKMSSSIQARMLEQFETQQERRTLFQDWEKLTSTKHTSVQP